MAEGWLGNVGTGVGLGVAICLVVPWLRWRADSPQSQFWGLTVGLAALLGTGVWLETGTTLPGAIAGAGALALGGLFLWGIFDRSRAQHHQHFAQTLTQLLTGQRAWDSPTLSYLFRTAPPAELPRLRATLRYMYEQQPELRALLTPYLEKP